MANSILTESGDKIVGESIPGITSASSLNDARASIIFKETFTVNPTTTGWLIGTGWAWSAINGNVAAV